MATRFGGQQESDMLEKLGLKHQPVDSAAGTHLDAFGRQRTKPTWAFPHKGARGTLAGTLNLGQVP